MQGGLVSWGRGMKLHEAGPERQKFAVLVGSQTSEITEVAGPPPPQELQGRLLPGFWVSRAPLVPLGSGLRLPWSLWACPPPA